MTGGPFGRPFLFSIRYNRLMKIRYLVGIDEAGRGPLAGPVSVGAFCIPIDFDWTILPGAKDSKQMTLAARESVFRLMQKLKKQKKIRFAVAFSPAGVIDRKGIVPAIRLALSSAISKLEIDPQECRVLLDGGLRAPDEYIFQETIIRGDDSERVISAASIAAKVVRDRYMVQLSKKYPKYEFEVHKGYGTKKHRDSISKYGLCAIHRKTFCKAFDI